MFFEMFRFFFFFQISIVILNLRMMNFFLYKNYIPERVCFVKVYRTNFFLHPNILYKQNH